MTFSQSFTLVRTEQLTRCRPSFATVFFLFLLNRTPRLCCSGTQMLDRNRALGRDWIPGRGRYPFRHRDRAARFCLNIPDDRNRDRRVFIGQNQDKRSQIRKDCDGQDTNWPIVGCLSSEVLNQLLLSFFKFTGQNICLNGIKKFPTLKDRMIRVVSTLFCLTEIWELFWLSVTESADSEPLPLSSPMRSGDNIWEYKSISLC